MLMLYAQVVPSAPPSKRAKNLATFVSKLTLNMSVTSPEKKPQMGRASLAMAHQTLRSTFFLSSPLLCYEDRDPLFLFRPF